MRRVLNTLYAGSAIIAGTLTMAMCLLISAQVMLNLISKLVPSISLTIPSYADLAGFMLAASTFFALAPTLHSGGHIRVTLLVDRLSRPMQIIAERFALLMAIGVTGYALWFCVLLVRDSIAFNDTSTGMIAVPLWIPQSSLVVGLAIMLIALFDLFFTSFFKSAPVLRSGGDDTL